MRIIIKHTVKNIFRKPFRTLLIVLSLFLCSFAVLLCFDITAHSDAMVFEIMYGGGTGKADMVQMINEKFDPEILNELPAETDSMICYCVLQPFYSRKPGQYTYNEDYPISVNGCDIDMAEKLGLIEISEHPAADEVILNDNAASKLGYNPGDIIELYDYDGNKIPFKVKSIADDKGILSTYYSALVSSEGAEKLRLSENKNGQVFIDVKDNNQIDEVKAYINEKSPGWLTLDITGIPEVKNILSLIRKAFAAVFSVCVISAIIFILTVSERIINDRMSSAGTLRSLGVTPAVTVFFIILENIVYALFGSVPAVLIYTIFRQNIYDSIMSIMDVTRFDCGSMSPLLIVTVIAGALIITSGCAFLQISRSGTANVKDMIFCNKDTEYRFSPVQTAAGLVFAAAAAVLSFFSNSLIAVIACFMFTALSIYLLVPYVLVFVSRLLNRISQRTDNTIMTLSFAEASSKKSDITSGQLIAVTSALVVMVTVMADSLCNVLSYDIYNADVIVHASYSADRYDYINYIDGVEKTAAYWESEPSAIEINGTETKYVTVVSTDDADFLNSFRGMTYAPEDDEVYVTEGIALRSSIHEGDEVVIVFQSDSLRPAKMKFRVAGIVSPEGCGLTGNAVAVSTKIYNELFIINIPSRILVKTDGIHTNEVSETINYYSSSEYVDEAETKSEYTRNLEEENRMTSRIIKIFSFLLVLFAAAAVSSSQLIGMEGRRRELAVLMATSMTRSKIKKMLFTETLTVSVISLAVSVPAGILVSFIIRNAVRTLHADIRITALPVSIVSVLLIMLVFYVLTVILPYKYIRKMKISEQLKYE